MTDLTLQSNALGAADKKFVLFDDLAELYRGMSMGPSLVK